MGSLTFVLAGGGTAGHISPLLATADALRDQFDDARIVVLGSPGGLEETLVPEAGYELRLIPKVPFPRRPNFAAVRFPGAFWQAKRLVAQILREVHADVLVGFGGYVSAPGYVAARQLGVPIVVHDHNALPGLANRLGARMADLVTVAFPDIDLRGAVVTGTPLRKSLTTLDRPALREEALQHWGLRADLPVVVVTGGSLGAQRINETMAAVVDAFQDAGVQVLHITGRGKEFVPKYSLVNADVPYVVISYCDRMDLAYSAADLVVSRSGAGIVAELAAVGLPAVFVPLPIGNGEQALNAAHLVDAGAAVLVDNQDFTPQWACEQILSLVSDEDRLAAMEAAAVSAGSRDGAGTLAQLIADLLSVQRQ